MIILSSRGEHNSNKALLLLSTLTLILSTRSADETFRLLDSFDLLA